jgi:hypothetical protein
MTMMSRMKMGVAGFLVMCLAGCGYTMKVQLPSGIETIYVPNFTNTMSMSDRTSYEAGLEIDVTNAVIDRLIYDGNLRVVKEENADAILVGEIIAYEQESLRYNSLEGVSQYRLFITTRLTLKKRDTDEIIFQEDRFTGDSEFFIEGAYAKSERAAAEEAIESLAKKIVDRIIEDW